MNKNTPNIILLFLIVLLSASCTKKLLNKNYNKIKSEKLYANCIEDAAKPQPWEISSSLTAINQKNTRLIRKEIAGEDYILVSSWKADTTYYKNDAETGKYNTGNYPIWVTVAPELQTLCQTKKFGKQEGVNLRLKQLLGLPPTTEKNYFVEFWVKPEDLFRPCPDAEINDTSCDIGFPKNVSKEHKSWINDLRIASYYNLEWDKNYPWTELGYTYDWHPKSKDNIGLSEFVIGKNKDIVVKGFHTTGAYCNVIE